MIDEPCDIILQGGAGASVCGIFQSARKLAGRTGHDIIIVGNDVRVVVTPQMDEEQCRVAYTCALRERDRKKQAPLPEPERRALDTYSYIEDELEEALRVIAGMSRDLGGWHATHRDPYLRSMMGAVHNLALIARRVERLAAERVEQP